MKIAVVPDLHLNKSVYKGVKDRDIPSLPFRTVDFMKAFEYVVDKCIQDLHPDLLIVPGDVYDHPSPSNEVRGFLSSQLEKLTSEKIPVVILLGNHDVYQKNHALKDIQELGLKNIRVIEEPTILKYQDVKFLMFPYSLDIEQKKITIREEFNKFLATIKEEDDGTPSIFFGHFGVQNAKINEYIDREFIANINTETDTNTTTTEITDEAKKAFRNNNPNDICNDDLDDIGADYVFLGDYHEFQILGTKKCIAMYGGSLEKSDFSEIKQTKGFLFYDSDAQPDEKTGKCRFIECPNCRPMIELKGNFDDIKKQFAKEDSTKLKNAIVKISFVGTTDELIAYSTGLEGFKKELREKIDPVHIISIQKIKNQAQDEEASKLEKEIMEKGHMEAEDVIKVVKEILAEKIKDEKELEATNVLAQEIYDEVVKG